MFILYEEEYFSYRESAYIYVEKIKEFALSIPNQIAHSTNNKKYSNLSDLCGTLCLRVFLSPCLRRNEEKRETTNDKFLNYSTDLLSLTF